jgi:tRNA uridine 5-carbamoylmethylation protein Kti12
MPLIVVCGLPCAGKTTFANQLYLKLEAGGDEVSGQKQSGTGESSSGGSTSSSTNSYRKVVLINEGKLSLSSIIPYISSSIYICSR